MTAIAGINHPAQTTLVEEMLDSMEYRGPEGKEIITNHSATLGVCWNSDQDEAQTRLTRHHMAVDRAGKDHYAIAESGPRGVTLQRDPLGQAPLYYGHDPDGNLCFASEVKALTLATRDVHELPPGSQLQNGRVIQSTPITVRQPSDISSNQAAQELRRRLESAVEEAIQSAGELGSWLSGGLDSSALAALARPHLPRLHSFVAGISGSPDLEHARQAADFIGTEHHEVLVTPADLLNVLPQVIFHLESFDALLVRSSITNFLVARAAADFVPAVLSGEGADELFAGYAYLKTVPQPRLAEELVDITCRLHNTALQRVDRSASAHGLTAFTPFLSTQVLDFALSLPVNYKLRNGVEKWIVRMAMEGRLPRSILYRPKAKFWEGTGVTNLLAQIAEERISETEFARHRQLPDGTQLNTREEMMYYRIFKDFFGEFEDFSWMGRTKGAPVI